MKESNIPSVTDLIAERIKTGSQPGNRHDPFKVGGVIEGGAMRGVIGAGAGVAGQGYKQTCL